MLLMMFVVMFLGGTMVVARRASDEFRASLRSGLHGSWRQLLIASGRYTLGDVAGSMLDAAMRGGIPAVPSSDGLSSRSVTGRGYRRLLPGDLTFGISREDADRWGDLLAPLAAEMTELLVERADAAGVRLLGEVTVRITVDENAGPGRPTLLRAVRREPVPREVQEGPTRIAGLDEDDLTLTATAAMVAGPHVRAWVRGELVFDGVLAAGRYRLGRDADCEIVLADPRVSREHAELLVEVRGRCWLVDAGSKAGTLLNGRLVDARTELHASDEVQMAGAARLSLGEAQAV